VTISDDIIKYAIGLIIAALLGGGGYLSRGNELEKSKIDELDKTWGSLIFHYKTEIERLEEELEECQP
jgi:hypothetical protein